MGKNKKKKESYYDADQSGKNLENGILSCWQ